MASESTVGAELVLRRLSVGALCEAHACEKLSSLATPGVLGVGYDDSFPMLSTPRAIKLESRATVPLLCSIPGCWGGGMPDSRVSNNPLTVRYYGVFVRYSSLR